MPLPIAVPLPMLSTMSEHDIDVQFALSADEHSTEAGDALPDAAQIRGWVEAVLAEHQAAVEMSVRVVDEAEIRGLNQRYRQQPKSTNVLSFPASLSADLPGLPSLLGDLVISAAVVRREARAQGKPLRAHFAHMVVHGTLHLLGYDHQDDAQATAMEGREQQILAGLGFPDPYRPIEAQPWSERGSERGHG